MEVNECNLREVISCDKKDKVVDVARKLKEGRERHIIVTDKKKPVGIISTTDMNNRVVAENRDPKATVAEEIMTSPIMTCDIKASLAKTYFDMLKNSIFSCPVTDKGKLKGTLDVKEAMNHLVKSKVEE